MLLIKQERFAAKRGYLDRVLTDRLKLNHLLSLPDSWIEAALPGPFAGELTRVLKGGQVAEPKPRTKDVRT